MKKEKLNELLQLYIYDELNESEKNELEAYLAESPSAQKELDSMKKFFNALEENKPGSVNDDLLINSRSNLLRHIRIENDRLGMIEKLKRWMEELQMTGYKISIGGVTAVLVGVIIGYFVFYSSPMPISSDSQIDIIDLDKFQTSGMNVSNIRFDKSINGEKNIEIHFDAVKPLQYSGDINDKIVQQLLAKALVNDKNPGNRLRSVNALISYSDDVFKPDSKIKDALITAVKFDKNPGVRKAALETLNRYEFDDEIRDVVLFVLANDSNSGLRVAAINTLINLKMDGHLLDETIKSELNQRAVNDENSFIKYRAATLLTGE